MKLGTLMSGGSSKTIVLWERLEILRQARPLAQSQDYEVLLESIDRALYIKYITK
jgi:hypothetical protein